MRPIQRFCVGYNKPLSIFSYAMNAYGITLEQLEVVLTVLLYSGFITKGNVQKVLIYFYNHSLKDKAANEDLDINNGKNKHRG